MDATPPANNDAEAAAVRLRQALDSSPPSTRLQAAMDAGTHPRPEFVEPLLARCVIEPDLNVRETLTWALMRHPAAVTVPRLIDEVRSTTPQARSQALHTLSKIRDPRGWAAITSDLLNDTNDHVARTAWRAAVVLVPEGSEHELASRLVTHLGRGNRDVQQSLSRSLVALGDFASAVLQDAAEQGTHSRRVHAVATLRLRDSPDGGFDAALFDAELTIMLADAAAPGDDSDDQKPESRGQ